MPTADDFIDWQTNLDTYRYWFVPDLTPSSIKAAGGNYMFVRPTLGGWVPVYIGIADNLSVRICGHDRWPQACLLGATHVMAHTQALAGLRAAEERDLIGYWNPICNTHHRTPPTIARGGY
jgi:hypothetical protein